MDTTKLAVGQKVWMQSGDQFKEATVEEITENYVRVFIAPTGPFTKVVAKRWTGHEAGVQRGEVGEVGVGADRRRLATSTPACG
jgi:hypothetical protein